MAKILFVTTRNIRTVCGELQLIKNRSIVLREKFGFVTDFYGLLGNDKLDKKQEDIEANVVDFTIFNKNPVSFVIKYRTFLKKVLSVLKTEDYSVVVVSGAFPFNIAKSIKKSKDIHIVYDSHAAWDELIEFNPTPERKLRYKIFTNMEKKILKFCDSAFAVSSELKNYLRKKYKWNKDTFIVPCALKPRDFSVTEATELRKKWRNEIGVADDELLFIYSGGLSPWQSIDKAYDIFKKYKADGGKAKFLIMTPDSKGLDFPEASIMSFAPSQVSEVLFAGDIAMLIREDFITNHVAFPNKYLEYVLSNMFIISTPYLKDISKEIKENKLGMIIETIDEFSGTNLDRELSCISPFEKRLSERKKIAFKHSFSETLKPFADKLQ